MVSMLHETQYHIEKMYVIFYGIRILHLKVEKNFGVTDISLKKCDIKSIANESILCRAPQLLASQFPPLNTAVTFFTLYLIAMRSWWSLGLLSVSPVHLFSL